MTPAVWIALVGIALTGGTSLVAFAFKLGGLSQRVDTHDDDSAKLALRVETIEQWRLENSADVKVMRVLLENINAAINARKQS